MSLAFNRRIQELVIPLGALLSTFWYISACYRHSNPGKRLAEERGRAP